MRVVLVGQSLQSDFGHGHAPFVRGVCAELIARGHTVKLHEPPASPSQTEDLSPPLHQALDRADLVLVHESTHPILVQRIGTYRRTHTRLRLLFHDTHHRSVTDPQAMAAYDLRHYDGVLAQGSIVRDRYRRQGWATQAWTWHQGADTRHLVPRSGQALEGDLVWIGHWSEDQQGDDLNEFLLEPAGALGLRTRIHGHNYPAHMRRALHEADIDFAGSLPHELVPQVYARFAATVHVPRRAIAKALPGVPDMRLFEALACAIPLVSAPWNDIEGLFEAGADFLVARNGSQMQRHLRELLNEPSLARDLAERGRQTILARHSCAHRVDELLAIASELGVRTDSNSLASRLRRMATLY